MKSILILLIAVLLGHSKAFSQAQDWKLLNGPWGAHITDLHRNGTDLYALSKGGIFHLSEQSEVWEKTACAPIYAREMEKLRVENGTFWAITTEGALLRSRDNGAKWDTVFARPYPSDYLTESLVDVIARKDTVFVGTTRAIYRSFDAGENWEMDEDLIDRSVKRFCVANGALFALTNYYIYRCSDLNNGWKQVYSSYYKLLFLESINDTLYTMYENSNRMIRSVDGFEHSSNWDTEGLEMQYKDISLRSVGGVIYCWGNRYADFCSYMLYRSDDYGKTWAEVSDAFFFSFYHIVTFESFGNRIITGSKNGIYRWDNVQQRFLPFQNGINSTGVLQVFEKEDRLWVNSNSTLQYSDDGGVSWTSLLIPLQVDNDCLNSVQIFATKKRIYIFRNRTYIDYSEDNGKTWTTIETYPDIVSIYADESTLWVIRNIRIWSIKDDDPIVFSNPLMPSNFPVSSILVSKHGIIEKTIAGSRLFWSTDQGLSWQEDNGFSENSIENMALLGYFNGTLYWQENDSYYLKRLGDGEIVQWFPQDWDTGVPFYHFPIGFFEIHDGLAWMGVGTKGLYVADLDKLQFHLFSPNLPPVYPKSIFWGEKNIYVGTESGLYALEKPTFQQKAVVPHFSISPNPSSGSLILKSDQFFTESAYLTVLDAAGKRVLLKELYPNQQWEYDFTALPTGVYFLQISGAWGVSAAKWLKI